MIYRLCLEPGCGVRVPRGRCADHRAGRERLRGTPSQRGYGAAHRRSRSDLAASLPAECGYCGEWVYPGERWVAAHVVDGEPEAGYVPAHPACNERAKRSKSSERFGEGYPVIPRRER